MQSKEGRGEDAQSATFHSLLTKELIDSKEELLIHLSHNINMNDKQGG